MRRVRDNTQCLSRERRNDVMDGVRNVLGVIFHWPALLNMPNVTVTAPSLDKIEETPIAAEATTLNISSSMTPVVSTSVKRFTEISGVTVSIASPCVVTADGHGIADHEIIKFTTTGALPTGLTAFTYYYCDYVDADHFRVTAAIGGANINTSGSQSGTQSVWHET